MPIYDYACNDCGHRFEIKQSWSDDALTVCPECSGAIRRVLHPAGVIFKGSGWYITDSRKGNGSDGATGSLTGSSGSSSSSSTAKAETASAADS
jgi:putative FmdB family regulatory protein